MVLYIDGNCLIFLTFVNKETYNKTKKDKSMECFKHSHLGYKSFFDLDPCNIEFIRKVCLSKCRCCVSNELLTD